MVHVVLAHILLKDNNICQINYICMECLVHGCGSN